mgnify:FL=1
MAFNSFASNIDNVSIYNNDFNIAKETKNKITIQLNIDEQVKEYVYSYATSEDLFNADFESVIKSIGKDFNEINESECTVSISVTVSVGYDANFISVTVGMEASCDTWKDDLRKLRDDITAILNE